MEKRFQFDKIALNCLSYIESFDECELVDFQLLDGLTNHEILLHERKNQPIKLPKDLKKFYSLFNGVKIVWSVKIQDQRIIIGEMHMNRLDEFKRVAVDGTIDVGLKIADIPFQLPDSTCYCVSLDSCEVGEIVIVIRNDEKTKSSSNLFNNSNNDNNEQNAKDYEGEVWLIDLSYRWHFICPTFTQYFRLLVAHLGIIGWQLAFTPEGLSPVSKQWMNFFCKERLCIDLHWHELMKS
eukprot:gene13865-18594_t